jgi:sugar lactone lactonase YvrE
VIALVYLGVLVFVGDALASRWFSYASIAHRLATGLLVGLLLGTWTSYLAALVFSDAADDPMAIGALVSAWGLAIAAVLIRRIPPRIAPPSIRRGGSSRGEWVVIGLVTALVAWMMMSTYDYSSGTLRIASGLWSDFGPTTAIAQSFALGDGFPTEYPHYAGEPIRYHFLYYFQVGNLTYLGLDPALANNVLSISTMVAMLVLVMALGERLFRSRVVGWIGAGLFFFHGALSFVPYVGGLGSVGRVLDEIPRLDRFMVSGFPYRGEEWGIWTQIVFLNQRHLASAIGILLVIVLFLLDRTEPADAPDEVREERPLVRLRRGVSDGARTAGTWVRTALTRPREVARTTLRDPALGGYLVCGFVAGMLPLWNGAMFIAAAALLAVWFVLFPNRPQMIVLAIAAAIPSIPQLLWVRPGTMAGEQTYPSFFWGYTIDDPTPLAVATYFGFIFGPKLILAAVGLLLGTWRQARVFIAFTALVAVAFLVQLSVEVLANHKFINAWLVVVNLFAAYGLVRLWRARPAVQVPARLVALGLVAVIVAGGVIDLIPVKNQQVIGVELDGDPLVEWVTTETEPTDVFLTDIHVVHRILLAGRRLYFGWPYYAWSAGYAVTAREQEYRDLFALRSPRELVRRLQVDRIDYVAFDDGLRERGFAQRLNEELYRNHLETVFTDPDGHYGHLTIYRVPRDPGAWTALPDASPADMYSGGQGAEPGLFDGPRGVATDRSGTVFVADTGNHRIQQFSSSGNLIGLIGGPGTGPGQFDRPTGVAVTTGGRLLVADAGNRRVQEFDALGAFVREWGGPDPGFGEPTDLAVDGDRLFVLDAAERRVVRQAADGTTIAWGGPGAGDGQLSEPTGIAFAAGRVIVADSGNGRVVVFDDQGKFVRSWPVEGWAGMGARTADVAADSSGTVWVSNPEDDSILVYRIDGTSVGRLAPSDPGRLEGPAGLALKAGGAMFVADGRGNRISLLTQLNP